MKTRLPLVVSTLLLALTTNAGAGLIYSNGVPDNTDASNITTQRSADNFALASGATVGNIRFWWGPNGGQPLSDFSGTITYAFYEDAGGALGTMINSGTVSGVTSTPTGAFASICGGPPNCPILAAGLNLPSAVSFVPGTYWLELHEGDTLTSNDGTSTFWVTSAQTGDRKQSSSLCPGCGTPSVVGNSELAFGLSQAVPEPSTIALVVIGLGGLLLRRRRA